MPSGVPERCDECPGYEFLEGTPSRHAKPDTMLCGILKRELIDPDDWASFAVGPPPEWCPVRQFLIPLRVVQEPPGIV